MSGMCVTVEAGKEDNTTHRILFTTTRRRRNEIQRLTKEMSSHGLVYTNSTAILGRNVVYNLVWSRLYQINSERIRQYWPTHPMTPSSIEIRLRCSSHRRHKTQSRWTVVLSTNGQERTKNSWWRLFCLLLKTSRITASLAFMQESPTIVGKSRFERPKNSHLKRYSQKITIAQTETRRVFFNCSPPGKPMQEKTFRLQPRNPCTTIAGRRSNPTVVTNTLRASVLYLSYHSPIAAHSGQRRMYKTIRQEYNCLYMAIDVHTTSRYMSFDRNGR